MFIFLFLIGCGKSVDPNDLMDPVSTAVKIIIKGSKK